MAFLRTTNPRHEEEEQQRASSSQTYRLDLLLKVKPLLNHVKDISKSLYQPSEHIVIDKRMVKNKGQFLMHQYNKEKPVE